MRKQWLYYLVEPVAAMIKIDYDKNQSSQEAGVLTDLWLLSLVLNSPLLVTSPLFDSLDKSIWIRIFYLFSFRLGPIDVLGPGMLGKVHSRLEDLLSRNS
jgi:hypothetical protein